MGSTAVFSQVFLRSWTEGEAQSLWGACNFLRTKSQS